MFLIQQCQMSSGPHGPILLYLYHILKFSYVVKYLFKNIFVSICNATSIFKFKEGDSFQI